MVGREDGGLTELDNLCLLCHHHHFLKTHEGWTLTRSDANGRDRPTWAFEPQPAFGQEPDLGYDTDEAKAERRRRPGSGCPQDRRSRSRSRSIAFGSREWF